MKNILEVLLEKMKQKGGCQAKLSVLLVEDLALVQVRVLVAELVPEVRGHYCGWTVSWDLVGTLALVASQPGELRTATLGTANIWRTVLHGTG